MGLFNVPKRSESVNVSDILKKINTSTEYRPTIKIKKGDLSSKIQAICIKVKQDLGDLPIKIIDTDEKFLAYCKKAQYADAIALDTESDGLDTMRVHLAGVCIKSSNQESIYAPVGHISNVTELPLNGQVSMEAIKEGLEMIKNNKIIMHNAYYDVILLHQTVGVDLPIYFDTLICAELLNENEPHGLKYLYDKYVMEGKAGVHKFNELFDGIPITRIPPAIASYYCCHDADMTLDLWKWFAPYMDKTTPECQEYNLERVADLFWTVDMPMSQVLIDMKLEGIQFDFEQSARLKVKYTKLKEEALDKFNTSVLAYQSEIDAYNRIHPSAMLPMPICYNSPAQIKILFYDIAKIPKGLYKKEPTGTGKNVVDTILHTDRLKSKPIYEIVQYLSQVKMYDKAIGSFIDKLTETAKEHGGRIHADLSLTNTDTGRLASRNPNLQQVPSRLGDIRTIFTAGENRVFVNCDFSKQEPCILSSTCKDPKLIKVFEDGLDIYSSIASMMYPEYSYEDCLEHYPDGTTNHAGKDRRSAAKKVVLSIMYSKGIKSLAEDIHVSVERAQQIYDNVLTSYPVMAQWMKDTVDFAYEHGYVDNFYGRRRRLPALTKPDYEFSFFCDLDERSQNYYKKVYLKKLKPLWKNEEIQAVIDEAFVNGITITSYKKQKADDYRKVVNFCIQGGAAVVTKKAMLNIANNKRLKELGVKLVMSIHDQLRRSCRV